MVGELGLAEQALADLVVADQVEAVQGELTAQVGDEAAYHRLAPGPRHHRIGLYVEHRVERRRYPIDGTRERVTELGVLHGPVGSLPLSESPGRGHRPALSVGFYVVRNLECTRTEMGRYLVGSPQGTSGQRVGWGCLQGFEEGRSFDGKAVGETASNSFSAHGEQARRQIVQGYPKCHCGNGSDRVVATGTAVGERATRRTDTTMRPCSLLPPSGWGHLARGSPRRRGVQPPARDERCPARHRAARSGRPGSRQRGRRPRRRGARYVVAPRSPRIASQPVGAG